MSDGFVLPVGDIVKVPIKIGKQVTATIELQPNNKRLYGQIGLYHKCQDVLFEEIGRASCRARV